MNDLVGGKWIIFRRKNHIVSALIGGTRLVKLWIDSENTYQVGNIYIGKIQNIVKNINAAFVELGNGILSYLPLDDEMTPILLNRDYDGKLKIGDELVVQIRQEAQKTKQASVTTNLNLTGKYCVVSNEKKNISFSKKIGKIQKQEYLNQLKQNNILDSQGNWIESQEKYGLIFRTNIGELQSLEPLYKELSDFNRLMTEIIEIAKYRSVFSCLYQQEVPYINHIRDSYYEEYLEIITDDDFIFENMKHYFLTNQPEDLKKLRLYKDGLISLMKLYSMDSKIQEATGKKVWLKSGAYLVIEPTEALTVIDVNTGKYSGKGSVDETFLKINIEACDEIALQIKLRNISGIIVVDFINLSSKEAVLKLTSYLKELLKKDPVKCEFIDMTSLGLVEITRKRINKSLLEQIREAGE